MKKIMFLLGLFFCNYLFAQKEDLIFQLKEFIPEGYKIKDTAFGDLNDDGKMDVLMILVSVKEEDASYVDTSFELQRPLMILTQQTDGKLMLAKRNDNVVLCKQCGGVFGDPYAGLLIAGSSFEISFYGGSSWRWGDVYDFEWNNVKKTWVLDREEHSSFHSTEADLPAEEVFIPASEIDNITIDDFDVNGLNTSTSGKVCADKSYFYKQPDISTRRKAYVTKGDKVTILRVLKNFYQVFFTNNKGQNTRGFLLKKTVELIK